MSQSGGMDPSKTTAVPATRTEMNNDKDVNRRRFLITAVATAGTVGAGMAAWPFLHLDPGVQ